jgi:hypothetical protein
MPDDALGIEPKFSLGDEVSIYGGIAIYIVKSLKWDETWPMWIYNCFLKDDGTELTKPFPEQVLIKSPPLPLGRVIC